MCLDCGCGTNGEAAVGDHSHAGDAADEHQHAHAHAHSHNGMDTAPASDVGLRNVELGRSLLEKNDRLAEQNRGYFRAKKLFVVNLVSSPGSGKTALIAATAAALGDELRVGVVTGDLATDNDAARLRQAGIPVVPITTGTLCHLDASMIARAIDQMDLDAVDVLILENVGNLVCPADFDLGESCRVVLLSVTEGEDKPLKYPPIFHSANVVLVTKSDLAAATEFNRETAMTNLKRISHHAEILELSSRTGEGMSAWVDWLKRRQADICAPAMG